MRGPDIQDHVTYRTMEPGEEQQVCDLVVRVFTESVAPLYPPHGVREFLIYAASPAGLLSRLSSNHFVLVAELQDCVVGAIEVRNSDHVSLFFVENTLQRMGIGRGLWQRALDACIANRPDVDRITVHSSPNAAEAYRTLGFRAEGAEQTVNGIRFIPMAFTMKNSAGNQKGAGHDGGETSRAE